MCSSEGRPKPTEELYMTYSKMSLHLATQCICKSAVQHAELAFHSVVEAELDWGGIPFQRSPQGLNKLGGRVLHP